MNAIEELQWARLERALSAVLFQGALDADWEEDKHPRGNGGKFAKKGAGASSTPKTKETKPKTEKKAKAPKAEAQKKTKQEVKPKSEPKTPEPAKPSKKEIAARKASKIGFNLSLAERASMGTSFVPEQRAIQRLDEVRSQLAEVSNIARKAAKSPKQREVLKTELARYQKNLLDHFNKMMEADSRTLSSMITGPANFPTRRNEKRLNTAMKRINEYVEWNQRARGSIMKAIAEAATPEQKSDADWDGLRKDIDRNFAVVRDIDSKTGQFANFDRGAFTKSVQGKLERAAKNGQADLVNRALEHIEKQQQSMKKPFLSKKSKVWDLRASAEKAKSDVAKASTEAQETPEVPAATQFSGVDVVENRQSDRLELRFPGKPSEAIRADLKGRGFRWSPNAGAWQRQLTNAARSAAESVLDKHYERSAAEKI